ncbi:MAG: hypothetical protein LBE31_06730, partial [Deltaproteobacteria bacterium]|nr:hypothetical protein [Deltaproteobacteria bacterium]
EETYATDISSIETINREILALAVKVSKRMRENNFHALTITLKARDGRFKTFTRSKTFKDPFQDHRTVYKEAVSLFPSERRGPWRLLGVTVSNLVPDSMAWRRVSLFDKPKKTELMNDLDKTMDAVNQRFGSGSLLPASLLEGRPQTVREVKPDFGEPQDPDEATKK